MQGLFKTVLVGRGKRGEGQKGARLEAEEEKQIEQTGNEPGGLFADEISAGDGGVLAERQ